MQSDMLREAISEVERLRKLSVSCRESEGIYASDSQLKLLLKNIKAGGFLSGATRFVADFSSMDSKLLSIIDKLENGGGA